MFDWNWNWKWQIKLMSDGNHQTQWTPSKLKYNRRRKSMQENEPILVDRCELKTVSLGITVRHHSASLVMPNSYPRDVIFNPHLTTIKDYYNPERLKIAENIVGHARTTVELSERGNLIGRYCLIPQRHGLQTETVSKLCLMSVRTW